MGVVSVIKLLLCGYNQFNGFQTPFPTFAAPIFHLAAQHFYRHLVVCVF